MAAALRYAHRVRRSWGRVVANGLPYGKQAVQRYAYWSDRRIRAIAEEYDIALERLGWTSMLKVPFLQMEVRRDRRTLRRHEIARRVQTEIGARATTDFSFHPVHFATGNSVLSFSEFAGISVVNKGVIVHTSLRTDAGQLVEVCLFGSVENLAGYVGAGDPTSSGWVSSAAPAVFEFVASRGMVNNSQWDDMEAISLEALKIAREQGVRRDSQPGAPWTRGFTLSHAEPAEWLAEIYTDVLIDKSRWQLHEGEEVDRVVIGAPLWVRTSVGAVTRYRWLR